MWSHETTLNTSDINISTSRATTTTTTSTTNTTQQPTTIYRAPCTDTSDCTAQNTQAIGPFGALPCTATNMRVCSQGFCSCNNSVGRTTTTMTEIISTSFPLSKVPPSCYQCGSKAAPCSATDLFNNMTKPSQCTGDKQFCLTDIGHRDSKLYVYKRCVDEPTCKKKWLQETLALDNCMKLLDKFTSSGTYDCHFCCHGDGCNSGITPPDNNTLYLFKQSL